MRIGGQEKVKDIGLLCFVAWPHHQPQVKGIGFLTTSTCKNHSTELKYILMCREQCLVFSSGDCLGSGPIRTSVLMPFLVPPLHEAKLRLSNTES